ncbi:MAG: branched-chain amino acid ABC transporter permease [Candidatus Atribacteria bacterium]|nr:branched-chain amino acid ABC transporter permease [Candidatus Atribacteria bacterium]MCK4309062.1 branched-chain amino acid ABC transporter permease [Candidatus Atribacteria bacterium]
MFNAPYIFQQIFNGIVLGSIYALLALGMAIIYGILGLINFAHGALITVGAFCFYFLFSVYHWSFILVIFLAIALGGLMGFVLEAIGYRKLRGAPGLSLLITSLGIYIFIENAVKLLVSPQPYAFSTPSFLDKIISNFITFRLIDLFIIATTITIMICFAIFVKRNKVGIAMRGISESVEKARLVGINVNQVIIWSFIVASAIAALTGFMWGSKYGQISYNMGFMPGIIAFVSIVIGGIGSIPGAVLGGFLIGLIQTFSIGFLPPGWTMYRDAIVFALLIVVLLIKPTGIMGRKESI